MGIGDYINWKKHGKGVYYYNNGDKYEGDFNEGQAEGKGKYFYKNGDRYEGDFKNDTAEGKGIYLIIIILNIQIMKKLPIKDII